MSSPKFATALNCIDGRTQIPVIQKMKTDFAVDFVDLFTWRGMDKAISEGTPDFLNELKNSVALSVEVRPTQLIAIAGHHDCIGNPTSEAIHKRQIRESIRIIQSWNFPVDVIGLWVNRDWKAEVLGDSDF